MENKNYKPFDLAKAQAGAKVMTRDGHEVELLKFNLRGVYPIVGYVQYKEEESDNVIQWTKDGLYDFGDYENSLDLVMCSEKHEGWINVYKDTNATYAGSIFKTKEEAIVQGSNTAFYITTTKIEWEE